MKVLQPHRWRACPPELQRRRAFSLFECLVVAAVAAMVAVIGLLLLKPGRNFDKFTACNIRCVNNLKGLGTAFRVWAGDHNDKYPMTVSVTNGGSMELLATGNVTACFQVMSNALPTPEILYCPGDDRHQVAVGFDGLGRANLSYFISLDAAETDPQAVLSGDANLVQNGRAVASGILNLKTNIITWTQNRHMRHGNVLFCDGAVDSVRRMGLTNFDGETYNPTNKVVIP